MKKLLFAIVAFFVTAPSFAQFSSGGFSLDQEHLYWGMRIGVNFASIGGDVKSDKGRTGMTLAGVVGLRVSESTPVFLESGLYYTQRGARRLKTDNLEADLTGNPAGHLNYLEIPILIKYGIPVVDGVHVLPLLGPYFSMAIDGRIKNKALDIDTSSFHTYKHPDMGIKVGCGAEYNNLYLELAYKFGIANIADDSLDSRHGHAFTVEFGVNF